MVYHIKYKKHILTVMSLTSLLSTATCLPGSAPHVGKTTLPLLNEMLENNRKSWCTIYEYRRNFDTKVDIYYNENRLDESTVDDLYNKIAMKFVYMDPANLHTIIESDSIYIAIGLLNFMVKKDTYSPIDLTYLEQNPNVPVIIVEPRFFGSYRPFGQNPPDILPFWHQLNLVLLHMNQRPIWVCESMDNELLADILKLSKAKHLIIDNKAEWVGQKRDKQLPKLFDQVFEKADEEKIKVVMSVHNKTSMSKFSQSRFFISPDDICYTEQLKIARAMIDTPRYYDANKDNTQISGLFNKNYMLKNGKEGANERWRKLLDVSTDATQKYSQGFPSTGCITKPKATKALSEN